MIKPGLARISRLLQHTPLPWRAIHVAGTNGKGSVSTYISRMLEVVNKSKWFEDRQCPPLKHGRFTSPHLIDRWDCISINDRPVDATVFRHIEELVLRRVDAEKDFDPSQFEILTAVAFEIFTQRRLDVAVIEAGMGGREDATNVLGQRDIDNPTAWTWDQFRPRPLASVITKVDYDHQGFLGDTIEEIAAHKAGIIKKGVSVLYDHTNPDSVVNCICKTASSLGATRLSSSKESTSPEMTQIQLSRESVSIFPHTPVTLPTTAMNSQSQQINTILAYKATAIAINWHVEKSHREIKHNESPGAISPPDVPAQHSNQNTTIQHQMLLQATKAAIPGRQQFLSVTNLISTRKSPVLLDGAHNPNSMEMLHRLINRELRSPTRYEARCMAFQKQQQHQPHEHDAGEEGEDKHTAALDDPLSQQQQPITWLLAASSGRSAASLFTNRLQPGDRVFLTRFGTVDGMPWVQAQRYEELEAGVQEAISSLQNQNRDIEDEGDEVVTIDVFRGDLASTLRAACEAAGEGPLVIAGSLYLAGDVLRLLREAGGSGGGEAGVDALLVALTGVDL